jgi:hypothetical protein
MMAQRTRSGKRQKLVFYPWWKMTEIYK